jgi:hypothetical protein
VWLEHLLFGVEEVAKALDCLFLDIFRRDGCLKRHPFRAYSDRRAYPGKFIEVMREKHRGKEIKIN